MNKALHIVCPHCNTINRIVAERLADAAKCGRCKKPLFPAHPVELNASGFERQIQRSDIPVVVDFWAPWCAPCRMMAPAYEQAASRLEPRVRLAKLNTEQEQLIASQLGIRSIPTLAIFNKGQEIVRQPGAMDLEGIVRWVNAHV
ncbi:MAG: thioredoxin TrxC [Pseudomonadota bacterium]